MNIDDDRAQIGNIGRIVEDIGLASTSDDAADIQAGKIGKIRTRLAGEADPSEGLDHLRHLMDRVYGSVETAHMAGPADRMDGEMDDPSMHGRDVPRSEGLGDQCRIGSESPSHQMMHALSALRLAHHESEDQ